MRLMTILSSKIMVTLLLLCFAAVKSAAQVKDPVKWSYAVKKLNGQTYEVHMLAMMESGWHIYAQQQSADAIAIPTSFKFDMVPGFVLLGKPKELGKKELYVLKDLGISNAQYAGKVDFVQKARFAGKPGTIKGQVTYQACTHQECLPEKTIRFSVPIK